MLGKEFSPTSLTPGGLIRTDTQLLCPQWHEHAIAWFSTSVQETNLNLVVQPLLVHVPPLLVRHAGVVGGALDVASVQTPGHVRAIASRQTVDNAWRSAANQQNIVSSQSTQTIL